MTPSRPRLIGLSVMPALLIAAVIATIIAVGSNTPDAAPASSELALPPVVEVEPQGCRRDRDDVGVTEVPVITADRRVTSSVVVSCPTRFDGLRVTYIGEAVGDLLHRDGGAWVLVNDDDYALEIGPLPGHRDHRGTNSGLNVWLPDPLHERLTGLGRPGLWGDVIEVTGQIVRTDPDDGGGLTLRAEELSVLQPSRVIEEPLNRSQLVLAVVALLAAAVATAVTRRAGNNPPQE